MLRFNGKDELTKGEVGVDDERVMNGDNPIRTHSPRSQILFF